MSCFFPVVLILILILGGDVEMNRGPASAVCKHLNICHVLKYRKLILRGKASWFRECLGTERSGQNVH